MQAADAQVIIDLVQLKRRRFLSSKALSLFVSPDGSLSTEYATPAFRSHEHTEAAEPLQVVEAIN